MKHKDKKNLLLLLFVIAVSSAIISGFTPITSWNSSDYYKEEYFTEDYPILFVKDNSYFLVDRMVKDDRLSFNSEHHVYTFFSFFRFETGNPEVYELAPELSDYGAGNTGFFTKSTFSLLLFILSIGGIVVLTYLAYLSIKFFGSKKINYFLYISLGEIVALILFTIGGLYDSLSFNVYNVSSGFSINYGFFIAVFSICLFLILHFKQNLILESNQKELENKKLEF